MSLSILRMRHRTFFQSEYVIYGTTTYPIFLIKNHTFCVMEHKWLQLTAPKRHNIYMTHPNVELQKTSQFILTMLHNTVAFQFTNKLNYNLGLFFYHFLFLIL